MMYSEIIRKVIDKVPGLRISDCRPFDQEFIPKSRPGLVVWAEDGDVIIYFPREEQSE